MDGVSIYDIQIERIKLINKESAPFLEWFDRLPGDNDRDKTVYLLLKIGVSPERISYVTGLSRRTIERRIEKGF